MNIQPTQRRCRNVWHLLQKSSKRVLLASSKFQIFWNTLNGAQKLYFTALAIFPLCLDNIVPVIIITIAGLAMDFWPRLLRVWETLIGKAVILLFYAGVTNFAIASAESLVNEVLKVSASNLAYTLNLSILLHLPIWVFACTLSALLLLQLILPFYMFIIVALKPFRNRGVSVLSHTTYPIITTLARIFLIGIIFAKLIMWATNSTGVRPDINFGLNGEPFSVGLVVESPIDEQRPIDMVKLPGSASVYYSYNRHGLQEHLKINDYLSIIKQLIADFSYYYEGNSYSRCEKTPSSSVIELNDYEILEIMPDESQEFGYLFTVKKCTSPAFPINKRAE